MREERKVLSDMIFLVAKSLPKDLTLSGRLFLADLDVSQSETFQDLGLCFPHAGFFFRLRMVMPEQMQDSVNDQKLYFRFERMPRRVCLGPGAGDGNQDVTDIACTRLRVR